MYRLVKKAEDAVSILRLAEVDDPLWKLLSCKRQGTSDTRGTNTNAHSSVLAVCNSPAVSQPEILEM